MSSAPEQGSRVVAFFAQVGLAVISLTLFFLVFEVGCRLFDVFNEGTPFFEADRDAVLYTEHPYMFRIPRAHGKLGGFEVNALGFRGPEITEKKPAETRRVLVLGGSAAWDTGVHRNDRTWTAVLERQLNERARGQGETDRVQVINGGVPAYTSAESLMNLIWRGLPLEPDVVLFYEAYNDFKPNRASGFRPDYSHYRKQDHELTRELSRASRAVHHFIWLMGKLPKPKVQAFDTVSEEGLAAYRENLRRIAAIAKSYGATPMFSTYGMTVSPENFRDHPKELKSVQSYLKTLTQAGIIDAHRRYNATSEALARELSVPVAHIHEGVPSDFDHYIDHCHFNELGAERAASAALPDVYAALFPQAAKEQ